MKSSGSKAPRVIAAALAVVAAGAVGFFAYRAKQAPFEAVLAADPDAYGEQVQPDPAETPEPPEPPKGKSIPDTLPDVTLADSSGKPTKLTSFGGRPLMVNFWATWCAPCRREIPLLNKIRTQRQAQNGEIVGIAIDFREDVLAFVKKVPLSYPLLMGEEDGLAAAEAFGMGMALPFSVFVDSKNRILTIKVGELHEDEANFAFDRLRDIDNGVLTHEAAQAAVADAFREMAAERARNEAAVEATSNK